MKTLALITAIALILLTHVGWTYAEMSRSHQERFWDVQAIDTMKFSRDLAREKLADNSYDEDIERQVKNIAATGATHISIATPYEDEFIPYLTRWVDAARRHHMNVWFRGNLAGWEEWFDYPLISREEHTEQITRFILNNPTLFMDGDIFVSCPECENGGPGDPRLTGDTIGFRNFLLTQYNATNSAFEQIDKDVDTHYYSMNGDVAKLVMDEDMTNKLGGVVVIDHYVESNEQFAEDIVDYVKNSKGSVILGEWGAPIPDIHGEMTEEEQAAYIEEGLEHIIALPEVTAINYWTHMGSSTAMWNNNYEPRYAVSTLTTYFRPKLLNGTITNSRGIPINDVKIESHVRSVKTTHGKYTLPVLAGDKITIQKEGYIPMQLHIATDSPDIVLGDMVLERRHSTFIDKFLDYIYLFLEGKTLSYATMNV